MVGLAEGGSSSFFLYQHRHGAYLKQKLEQRVHPESETISFRTYVPSYHLHSFRREKGPKKQKRRPAIAS
jgi:hypothetical protein